MTTNNILIGALIVIVVLFGGYYVFMTPVATPTTTNNTTVVTQTPTPAQNPAPTAPAVKTDSTASVSSSAVVLTGKVTPNGAQTSYWYEYGSSTSLGSKTNSQSVGSGFVAIPAPIYITGLSASSPYYYRLSAQNAYGTVNGQTYAFTTNTEPPPTGIAPTTHSDAATGVTRTTANLNGQINPNGSDSFYWFEWGTSADLGVATALQSAGAGSAEKSVSLSLSDLTPLTKYYFRLNTQNRFGTVNGSILSFNTTGPAAPGISTASTNSATAIATSSATLNGHVNPNGAPTEYWFEYGVDPLLVSLVGQTTNTNVAGAGTASVAVSSFLGTVHPKTKYYFRIVARSSYGTVRGDINSFTTK